MLPKLVILFDMSFIDKDIQIGVDTDRQTEKQTDKALKD